MLPPPRRVAFAVERDGCSSALPRPSRQAKATPPRLQYAVDTCRNDYRRKVVSEEQPSSGQKEAGMVPHTLLFHPFISAIMVPHIFQNICPQTMGEALKELTASWHRLRQTGRSQDLESALNKGFPHGDWPFSGPSYPIPPAHVIS